MTVQTDAKQFVSHQSGEDSKQDALVSHDQAESLETTSVAHAHVEYAYEQADMAGYKSMDQKTLALLENTDFKTTKWRDF